MPKREAATEFVTDAMRRRAALLVEFLADGEKTFAEIRQKLGIQAAQMEQFLATATAVFPDLYEGERTLGLLRYTEKMAGGKNGRG